jgi:SAM-dependent methyltransferase
MGYEEIWNKRYSSGDNSGRGSYGEHFSFKTRTINQLIEKYNIKSVIDFGCGDGNQIKELNFNKYKGYDLSKVSVEMCKRMYAEDAKKSFELYEFGKKPSEKAELTMSLDVVYHLIEDEYFEEYMSCLMGCTEKYILVYSTNYNSEEWSGHVKHREFETVLSKDFQRIEFVKNELDCPADFYLYCKK